MSILVDEETRVLVQGITGQAARHHTRLMLDYGTKIVAGVRPGSGGETVEGIPVYDSAREAVDGGQANAAILFVPAPYMKDVAFDTMDAGVRLLILVTEHVPLHDTLAIIARAAELEAEVVGPNTPGLIAPGLRCKIGFVPQQYYRTGPVGVASRSGTLTYEIVSRLTLAGIGQSLCVGVGGDAVVGTTFAQMVMKFEADAQTQAILLIGEVGGGMEEQVAEMVVRGKVSKPVVAYIAGRTAPPGKRMGHAGAIVAEGRGSIESKLEAFKKARIPVAAVPDAVLPLVKKVLN